MLDDLDNSPRFMENGGEDGFDKNYLNLISESQLVSFLVEIV